MFKKKPKETIVIKKVKAYPIATTLKSASAAYPAQIVKLTQQGFLVEANVSGLKPGEKFDCSFEIPLTHYTISQQVVAVKVYSQTGKHLIEMHFTKLGANDQKSIAAFTYAIRQTE